jgi:LAS superfamily LD-carboxypeptidase LdcB
MMLEMEQAGVDDVFVTSSYRSYSYQKGLYEGYVNKHMAEGMSREDAEVAASRYSARAGESEHQTGLCLDFTTDSIGGSVDEDFEGTSAFAWLSQNAYRFGFILRYPADKVAVTEYDYEPWHYRFVGRAAATEIYFGSLCLEEYLNGVS